MPSDLETYLEQVEKDMAPSSVRGHVPTLLAMLKAILRYDEDGHAFDVVLAESMLAVLDRLAREAMEKSGG
jgi:hypothetical protein